MKAEKESIIDIQLTQIDANKAQRSDPILTKIIAAKEEDKRPARTEISVEGPFIEAYWAQCDSLNLINGFLYRHWESANGKILSNLIVVPFYKMKKV